MRKYNNIFSKGHNKNWPRKIFIINSVWETHPWTHQIKHFNGEKVIGKFYEKELL